MKNVMFWLPVLLLLQSCAVAGGIFKAGVWVGILVVVVIAVVIFMAASRKR